MARTRHGGSPRCVNNIEDRRFAAAKEIANARRRDNTFKIKFLLIQGKNIDVKVRGDLKRLVRPVDLLKFKLQPQTSMDRL